MKMNLQDLSLPNRSFPDRVQKVVLEQVNETVAVHVVIVAEKGRGVKR
jgi:hypothetical protein